jgi:uncharacterized protein YraI
MYIHKLIVAGAFLALSTGGVLAAPVATGFATPLMAGPGGHVRQIALIPQGSFVDVQGCGESSCRVNWNGADGFVSRAAIGAPYVYRDLFAEETQGFR